MCYSKEKTLFNNWQAAQHEMHRQEVQRSNQRLGLTGYEIYQDEQRMVRNWHRFFWLLLVVVAFCIGKALGAECEVVLPVVSVNDLITARAKTLTDLPTENGSLIDVMVLYTPQARIGAGGAAAVIGSIQATIAAMSQAMVDSGVPTTVNICYTGELYYKETGDSSSDLYNLAFSYTTGAQALRDQYGADLVSLVCNNLGGPCGTGYLMQSNSPVYSSYAYSVVQRSCFSQWSLAHELGHNMGLCHNRENSLSGTPAIACGYGAHTTNYGTIMCYPPWTRVNLWGGINPVNLVHGQWPIGDPDNDCATALRQVLKTVANYRPHKNPSPVQPTPTPAPVPTSLTYYPTSPLSAGTPVTLTWPPAAGKTTLYIFKGTAIVYGLYTKNDGNETIILPNLSPGINYTFVEKADLTGKKRYSAPVTIQ